MPSLDFALCFRMGWSRPDLLLSSQSRGAEAPPPPPSLSPTSPLSIQSQHSSPGEKNRAGFLPPPGGPPGSDWAIVCSGLKVIPPPPLPSPRQKGYLRKGFLGDGRGIQAEKGRGCPGGRPWPRPAAGGLRGPGALSTPSGLCGFVGELGSRVQPPGAKEGPSLSLQSEACCVILGWFLPLSGLIPGPAP